MRADPNDWTPEDGPDDTPVFDDVPEAAEVVVLKPAPAPQPWLIDAADLLAEPDPGPTPWLVEGLIVDRSLLALVGPWKATKSYGTLDLCISIATGEPAFGTIEIPKPGPVVFVNEESGRTALWRRLDALCRGRAIDPERLRGLLHVSANARVLLDDKAWQDRLIETGKRLQPRLYIFDPLARMKAAGREENDQSQMAPLIEYMRLLREETNATIGFVHHQGHAGTHMRGSSDLESAWECRLTWKRDGQSPLVTVTSEHREAEAGEPIEYRISWDHDTRSMRFNLVAPKNDLPPLEERIVEWLQEHPNQKAEEVGKGLGIRASDVRKTLLRLEEAGRATLGSSGRRDKAGRAIRDKVWNVSNQAGLWVGPNDGMTQDDPETGHGGSSQRPTSIRGRGTAKPHESTYSVDADIPF